MVDHALSLVDRHDLNPIAARVLDVWRDSALGRMILAPPRDREASDSEIFDEGVEAVSPDLNPIVLCRGIERPRFGCLDELNDLVRCLEDKPVLRSRPHAIVVRDNQLIEGLGCVEVAHLHRDASNGVDRNEPLGRSCWSEIVRALFIQRGRVVWRILVAPPAHFDEVSARVLEIG